MTNPTQDEIDQQASLTSDAIYLRGLFIQRYAMIEFALSHLLVMASFNPAYHALGELPHRNATKLKRLGQVLSMNGPLKPYAVDLQEHVDYINSIEVFRNFIAHGGMLVFPGADEPVCKFRCYQHVRGVAQIGNWNLTMSQLEGLANDLQPHSTAFTALVAKVGSEVIFAPNQPNWTV